MSALLVAAIAASTAGAGGPLTDIHVTGGTCRQARAFGTAGAVGAFILDQAFPEIP